MAREKKPVHRVQMTEGKRNIIRQLLEEYDIESAPSTRFRADTCQSPIRQATAENELEIIPVVHFVLVIFIVVSKHFVVIIVDSLRFKFFKQLILVTFIIDWWLKIDILSRRSNLVYHSYTSLY